MANANYLTSTNVGANLASRTTTPEFQLGMVSYGNKNTTWIYGQASEAVTSTCTVNPTTFLITDAAGNWTADVAFAANEYGWVRLTAGAQA